MRREKKPLTVMGIILENTFFLKSKLEQTFNRSKLLKLPAYSVGRGNAELLFKLAVVSASHFTHFDPIQLVDLIEFEFEHIHFLIF